MFGIRNNIALSVMVHVLMVAAVFVAGSSSELRQRSVVSVSLTDAWNTEPDGGQKGASGQQQQRTAMPAREMTQKRLAMKNLSGIKPTAAEEAATAHEAPGVQSLPDNSPFSPSASSPEGEGKAAGDSASSAGSGTAFPSAGRAAGTAAVTSGGSGTVQQQGASGDTSLRQRIRAALQANLVYPYIAKKKQMEGSVMVSFRINQTGNPESIRILKGSGYSILDSAARETVVKASPFPAANNFIEVPITFTLKDH
ncbi:MAG: energy transducer TonB [Nitrospirae bacterium]|nr:energy transducer TonB [Nitrospirota bacterium]